MINLLLLATLLLNIIINILVFRNSYHSFLPILWLISLLILIFYSLKSGNFNLSKRFKLKKHHAIILVAILLPVVVRIINLNTNRIHQDEFISAYFSTQYNFKSTNFFASFPEENMWVSQFPTPYFALQKIFFLIFTENPLAVKLSIMPYVFLVSLMLYLIARQLFNREVAIISLIVYAFFPISIYLETWGLHFISSTAVFLVFFYFLIRYQRKNNLEFSLLSGVSCGFNYLFYLSSYIALPLGVFIYLLTFFKQRKIYVIKHFLLFLISFLLVTSPFLTYALTQKNYLPVRLEDVSFIAKVWTNNREKKIQKEAAKSEAMRNLKDSVKSFYTDKIGGHGGYDFGKLALFERFSLILFILGLTVTTFLSFKKIEIFFIQIIIFISYIFGMVLTTPPPAYHRFSIAFPFISLISSMPFYILLSLKPVGKKIRYFLCFIFLSIYIVTNQAYFSKAVAKDIQHKHADLEHLKIINYIKRYYPSRKIYIAAFPTHGLKMVYYFFDRKTNVIADYHQTLIDNFSANEKYVYIILFPEGFSDKFAALDKNGRLIKNVSDGYALFAN